MERRLHDPLGSCTSSGYNSLSDHDCPAEMMSPHHKNPVSTFEDDWDEGDTFISFTTTETKCEELYEEGLQHKLRGELHEALPCFMKCLEGMQECHYFAKLPQTLNSLAEIHRSLNCYDKALEFAQAEKLFYEAVVLDSTKTQAPDGKARTKRRPFSKKPRDQTWRRGSNPAEYGDLLVKKANEYIHLAKLCAEQKTFELALEYCAKAAKIHKSVFGDSHPVTAETMSYQNVLYAEAGKAQYATTLATAHSSEVKEPVIEDKRDELLHVEAEQSFTNGDDKTSNTTLHLSREDLKSAGLSSTCTAATTDSALTIEQRSADCFANNPVECVRKAGGRPEAKEATLLLNGEGERELDLTLPLKTLDKEAPSLDQGWKEPPYKEARQDVCSGKPTLTNEGCQNSPYRQTSSKGHHHQETSGIHYDLSDTSATDTASQHSCATMEHSNVGTINEPSHTNSPTQFLSPKKGDIEFYEPNQAITSKQPVAVISGVLSKAPACVYVPAPEQGIEHARCLPLWVLILGAFVEFAILAYVFLNRV